MLLKAVVLFVLLQFIVAHTSLNNVESELQIHPVEINRPNPMGKRLVSATIGNKTYYVEFARLNFFKALEQCEVHDWQLARIQSEEETEGVNKMIRDHAIPSEFYWIAGNDQGYTEPRNWFWMTTGRPILYSNWAPGEPNNVGGVEGCIHLDSRRSLRWNDHRCSNQYYYICEKVEDNK